MAVKVVKWAALPAAVGVASFRVYAMTEEKTDEQISPRELSIYNPEPPVMQYVEQQPGRLETGLGRVRVGLQPYVRTVQNACTSVKVGVISLCQAGRDTYEFLRAPPPGFLPRVGVITVSGLAGLVLARRGSRVKRVGVPLALTAVGAAVCYPTHTVGALKFTGMQVYSASSLVASAFKSKPKEDFIVPPASLELVTPNFDPEAKVLLVSEPSEAAIGIGATSDTPSTTPEMVPTPTGTVAPSTPETELVVVADVAESDVACLPETEPTLSTVVSVSAEVPSESAPEDVTNLPEDQPADDTSASELAPIAEVTPLFAVPQEDAPVPEVDPAVDVAPNELVPLVPDFALEEAIPVEVTPDTPDTSTVDIAPEVTSEMTEDVTIALPDVTPEDATFVNETVPTENASPAEVAPLPLCEVALAEDALVAQVAPPPEAAPEEADSLPAEVAEVSPVPEGNALPDLVPEETVIVSEMDAAAELDLIVETSPVVEVALVPDVTPEEVAPTEDTIAAEIVSAEVAPAVDAAAGIAEFVAESPTELNLVAEASPLSSRKEPEPEPESTIAPENVPEFEVDPEAVTELVPTEEEATPLIPLPIEGPATSNLSTSLPAEEDIPLSLPPTEPTPSPTALEASIPLPPAVEETSPLPSSVEETTPGPSTTDKIGSIPDVIDEATLTLAVGLETASSSPADEATLPTHAEDETKPLPSAAEDTTLPPPALVQETKPLAEVEEVLALLSPTMKGKPRFVPDPSLVDHGQSHPEDADMYSTRE